MATTTTLPTPQQQLAAKRVPILDVITCLGIAIVGTAAGGNYYCLAPWRQEASPSLVVCEPKNCWIDFGEVGSNGKPLGGDVLSLVMKMFSVRLPVARTLLGELVNQAFTTQQRANATPSVHRAATSEKLSFTDVTFQELSNPILINYLTSRCINWSLVQASRQTMTHLLQVDYRLPGKERKYPYFALAWKTQSGHEIRNSRFQNCMGHKGITYLKGAKPGCAVFEGFFDYLSALTYFNVSTLGYSVLILNSANLIASAILYLRDEPEIHWFGDNDTAGEKALAALRHELPPGRVTTHNEIYREYKDFNDFLTKTPPRKPLPRRRAAPSKESQTAKWWLWVVFDKIDPVRSLQTGRTEYKQCTFYSLSNDENGYAQLLNLRHQLQWEWRYYRLCERTVGRKFRILHFEGSPTATEAALPESPTTHTPT